MRYLTITRKLEGRAPREIDQSGGSFASKNFPGGHCHLIAALAVVNNGCSHSGNPEESGDDSVSFDVNDPKIKERLGEDDGYALAIMYGADIHGSLETCG